MSTLLSLLTLPAEVRDNIWCQLIKSVLEEAASSNQYVWCSPKANFLSYHACYLRLHQRRENLKLWRSRLPNGYFNALKSDLAKLYIKGATKMIESPKSIMKVNNPLLSYLGLSQQVKAEIQGGIARVFPNGRYIKVKCCCGECIQQLEQECPLVVGEVIHAGWATLAGESVLG